MEGWGFSGLGLRALGWQFRVHAAYEGPLLRCRVGIIGGLRHRLWWLVKELLGRLRV